MSIARESVACPLCASRAAEPFMRGPDRAHGVPGEFELVRCQDCGLVYQSPRPTASAFAQIYPDDYEPYQGAPVERGRIHPDLAMACAFVSRRQPGGGRLLDIGCGPGRFLQAMRLLHPEWRLAGVEPDPRAAAAALAAGLEVQRATIDDADVGVGWDAITLWNVVEHLPDPLATLRRARTLLRPGGALYLAVPMRDSWDSRIFGPYWTGWELPRHFTLFDRGTLERMIAEAGLAITADACINGRTYGFSASLRLLLQERLRARFAMRRLAEALTYSRPLALALAPYAALAGAARRLTVLTVAATPLAQAPAHDLV